MYFNPEPRTCLPRTTWSSTGRSASRSAFTLIELLTVLTIVGVLTGILLPAVQSVREAARRAQCTVRLKQLALASLNYESSRRQLPVGAHNSYWQTWLVQIMPFVEQQEFYDRYDQRLYGSDSQFNTGVNATLTNRLFSEFACPNDPPVRTTFGNGASAHSYVACTGNGAYVTTAAGWNTTPPVSLRPMGTFASIEAAKASLGGPSSGAQPAGLGTAAPPVLPLILPLFFLNADELNAAPSLQGNAEVVGNIQSNSAVIAALSAAGVSMQSGAKAVTVAGNISAVNLTSGAAFVYKTFQGGAYQMSGGSADLRPTEDAALLRDAIAVQLSDITDGISKTLAFSEVIRTRSNDGVECHDYRGLSWWGPGGLFSTQGTPNSHLPDVMPRKGDCVSDEVAPCTCPHTRTNPMRVLARSRHPGGVVAATCDGAIAFYPNDIDATVWENLGTTQGE